MSVVAVSRLAKAFGPVQAVRDVSFEVAAGEIFGLLGPNGAGKTTTLRLLLDIFRPDAGEIRLFDGPIDLARLRRVGYLPEDRGLYKDEPLEATLLYLATLKGMEEKIARRRLGDWLERFALTGRRKTRIRELSKGMQQKAQIIATLLHEPDLIIIDEPFAGLDPVNTRLVKQVLVEQQAAGRTILMSTHQMFQVEAMCQRIVLIDRGEAVLYGPVAAIKRRFAGNAIMLEGSGDFRQVPGVSEARRENGRWHLTLDLNVDPQQVLRDLALWPSSRITHFELAEPSLDDIFVHVVQQGAAGQATAATASKAPAGAGSTPEPDPSARPAAPAEADHA